MSSIANPFGPDAPNTPSSERIDSALDNFIKEFFGVVTKTQNLDGSITWTLPAPLTSPLTIGTTTRATGEGLAAFLARCLTEGVNAVAGKNGYASGTISNSSGSGAGSPIQPAVGSPTYFYVDDTSLFAVGCTVYVPGCGYYRVYAKSENVLSVINLYTSTDALHPGQLAAGSLMPTGDFKVIVAAPVGETGAKGDTGAAGPAGLFTADDVTLTNFNVTTVTTVDGNSVSTTVVKTKVKEGSIKRNHLIGNGAAADSELGVVSRTGGLKFSGAAGHGLTWGVDNGGLAANVDGVTLVSDETSLRVPAGSLITASAVTGIAPSNLTEPARNGTMTFAVETNASAANAYVVQLNVTPSSFVAGMRVSFMLGSSTRTNTGASTISVVGISGAKDIYRNGVALVAKDIIDGKVIDLVYDGTRFELKGNPAFTSAQYSLPGVNTAGPTSAHGFGVVPAGLRAVLVCVAANQGYSIGDEVPITSFVNDASPYNPAFSVAADASVLYFIQGADTTPSVQPKTGGAAAAITAASWNFKIYATKYPS